MNNNESRDSEEPRNRQVDYFDTRDRDDLIKWILINELRKYGVEGHLGKHGRTGRGVEVDDNAHKACEI